MILICYNQHCALFCHFVHARNLILHNCEDVEFVVDCKEHQSQAVTKIIIFSVSIMISCIDSVGNYSPNNEVSNHPKI
jgi:hypothetical protein